MQVQQNETAPQTGALMAAELVDEETYMVESEFIVQFRGIFFNDEGVPQWDPNVEQHVAVSNDVAAVFRKLYLLLKEQPQSPSGDPGSAERMVSDLLATMDWPNDPPVPNDWLADDGTKRVFRRYEIACAMNILMQVLNVLDPGGDPAGWPPKRP
jgi:hypothetical protein